MLTDSRLQTLVCTTRLAEAEAFYTDILGLERKGTSDGALVFNVGGGDLRISPVPSLTPSEHTVLGFEVDDVEAVIAGLAERGVDFVRFDGFPHEESGLLTTPDGSRVAWIRDPDGNLLSIVQYARVQ